MATTSTSSKKLTYYVYKSGNNTEPIRRALNSRGWESVDTDDAKASDYWYANFIWKPTWTNTKPCTSLFARQHSNASKRQVWNHFKAIEPLCTKDSLFETMRTYYASAGEEPFKHLPPTFLVEPKLGDVENWPGWSDFIQHFNKCANDSSVKRNLWLVKPTSANRGIGIEVFATVAEIKSFLETKARGASMGIAPIWVLQKYIENPLLYKNRKFDLRVWVLALDNGDIYMHAPGYVRTSSEVFDLESTNRYAHLTNYCQQVNAESFGKFEEGNTLTFTDLENYLTEILSKRNNGAKPPVASTSSSTTATDSKDKPVTEAKTGIEVMWGCGKNGLWGQMRSAVIDTFEALRGRGGSRSCGYEENGYARKPGAGISVPSGKGGITTDNPINNRTAGPSGSRHRFELLGLDFMIDSDFKIHFIEVNTNPSLSYQNDWHEDFVDDMAERLLDVVFADVFPELGTAPDEATIAGSPSLDNKRPAPTWQWVMNTYTSPLRHAATASVQAAADAFRSSRNLSKTATTTTNTTPSVSTSTINRTVNLAASKLLANKLKKDTPSSKDTKPSTTTASTSASATPANNTSTTPKVTSSDKEPDSLGDTTSSLTSTISGIDLERTDSIDEDSKESGDEDNGRTSGAENIEVNPTTTEKSVTTATAFNTATNNILAAMRSTSVSKARSQSQPRSTARSNSPLHKSDTDELVLINKDRSASALKSTPRVINKVPVNRVAAVFRPSVTDAMNDGSLSINGVSSEVPINNTPIDNNNTGVNRSNSRLRVNPNPSELGITGAGLIKNVNRPKEIPVSRGNGPVSSASTTNFIMPNGNVLDISAIDTDILTNSESPSNTNYSSTMNNNIIPPMSPIRVGSK